MSEQDNFHPRHLYRHIEANTTLDIIVLAVRSRTPERVKLKIQYRNRKTGRIAYTAKGSGEKNTDTVRIYKKDFHLWKFVGHLDRRPMLNEDVLMTEKPKVNIENWHMHYCEGDFKYLTGVVDDHPKQPMGMGHGLTLPKWDVCTSEIIKYDLEKNFVETINTIYLLGSSYAENIDNFEEALKETI